MERIGPYKIVRGPMAGLTVTAELSRLTSGEWQVCVDGEPWCDRFNHAHHQWTFPDCETARRELAHIERVAAEQATGHFIAPVTAS